ncbi:ABC transporter permease subunit [Natranaeroarchaeum sulfidigenes]|uniref:ABC-type transport system involved in multi-copper enzyme maturation, permease component n=1 Tax=Natranaeroarchaeum sulfidigenes TaxID=2784880 RepID=A0A897MW50_9EURY|nr:ABC transporter permease subunit [Natranaeroarchaeum sulfidigenes]QSG02386.1 ABC-type transport system involved in multi-copper enzyme maturation, permease component [Natranaeroarchaeum sulfidigenes]
MFEFLRYDGRKRIKGSVYLSAGMAILAAVVIWVYPSFSDSFDEDELLEAYPPQLIQLFDIETMASIEGFLAFELYVFGWTILLGLYLAYSAAGIIADDIDRGRMDTLLAMPVTRRRLLTEKFASLAVPILLVNVLVPPVVLASVELIGESISIADLAAIHLLSIPYLFACAGIGILCSVAFDRTSIAQRVALGGTFALFLFESLLNGTDYEAIGAVAPMRYFDPNEILLESSYDLAGAATLMLMTFVLVGVSAVWFTRKDV